MQTEDERRYLAALAEMDRAGIWVSNANPPALRMLRNMGLAARPPHYARAWPRFFVFAVFFGALWGLFMWFGQWQASGLPLTYTLAFAALAGTMFGAMMSGYYAWSRRRAKLSRWEDL